VINTGFAGLCQYPLHQMIVTLTITLNNQAITTQPSQLFDKFGHYNFDRETQKSTMSSTPCYPDQAITYELTSGRITSEFAPYASSVDHISRQHTAVLTFTSNPVLQSQGASATAQFVTEFTEPLMINPLIFDREWWRKPGIAQITNFTVNMTFDPVGIQRVWRQSTNNYVSRGPYSQWRHTIYKMLHAYLTWARSVNSELAPNLILLRVGANIKKSS
jgi:hypothetical protein